MAERVDVMISSTARDLPEYRQQAMDACVRQGMFPIMMEHLPAMDADAISASLAMVDEAEIYLGIVARRYGYTPAGYDLSITEMEYQQALERGIPRLIFLMDERHSYDAPPESPESQAKLAAFRERLQTEQVVNFFTTPADLRAQIINSLSRYHTRIINTFHRNSLIPSPPEPYIAHPYTLLETGNLFGRYHEMETLTDWIDILKPDHSDVRVMNIVAIGGTGKSALTWKWFNEIAQQVMEPAGRMWWSFYESDARYENFIIRTLAYISDQSEEAIRKMPMSKREEDLLVRLDQEPFLLVLDGFERLLVAYAQADTAQVLSDSVAALPGMENMFSANHVHSRLRKTVDPRAGNFLRKLANISQSRVLISTRLYPATLETATGTEIHGSKAIYLTGLDDDDAFKLWRSFGVSGSRRALGKLFRAFDNYPLLIRALAGEVARYRRAPGNFDRWQAANPGFQPFNLAMVQRQSHVLQFALTGLSTAQMNVLQMVAAFSSPAAYDTLAALLVAESGRPFASEIALDEALTELEDRGLLGWDRYGNRYEMHPVVRGVIWNGLQPEMQRKIYEQLRAHLEDIPPLKNWRDVQKFEDLTPTIELYRTLIGLQHYDDAYNLLSSHLYKPLRYRLSSGQQLATLLEMLFPEGTEVLPQLKKPSAQAWTLHALAQAYQMVGQPGRAAPLFRRSNQLKASSSNTVDLSTGLRDLAYAARLYGGLRESEAAARQALIMDRSEENHLLEAISLQVLGLALAAKGEWDESARALDRSLDLAERTNANRAYNHHAMRALWQEDYQSASEWAEQGYRYCQKRGLEAGLILAMRLKGQAALGLNDLAEAEEYLHQAVAHARSVILVEEEIAASIALADLLSRQGHSAAALELLDELQDAILQGPYRLFYADALNLQAQIYMRLDEINAAQEAALEAHQQAWCDGYPYVYAHGLTLAQRLLEQIQINCPDVPLYTGEDEALMPVVEIDPLIDERLQ